MFVGFVVFFFYFFIEFLVENKKAQEGEYENYVVFLWVFGFEVECCYYVFLVWGLEFGDGLVKGSWLSGCFEEVEEGFFEVGVKG